MSTASKWSWGLLCRGKRILAHPSHLPCNVSQVTSPLNLPLVGVAHLTAVVFCAWRISYLRRDRTGTKYRIGGWNRLLKLLSVLISLACLLIVLFQFNARLAADPNPLLDGKIAPFEWTRKLVLPQSASHAQHAVFCHCQLYKSLSHTMENEQLWQESYKSLFCI